MSHRREIDFSFEIPAQQLGLTFASGAHELQGGAATRPRMVLSVITIRWTHLFQIARCILVGWKQRVFVDISAILPGKLHAFSQTNEQKTRGVTF